MKTQWEKVAADGTALHFCSMCREYRPRTLFSEKALALHHHWCRPCHARDGASRKKKDRTLRTVSTLRKRERDRGTPCDPSFDAADVRALFALFGHACALTGETGKTLTVIRAHPDAPLGLDNGLPVLSRLAKRPPPRSREEHEAALARLRGAAPPVDEAPL